MRNCKVCGIDISDRKATAKTCSRKCRKDLSRLRSVTPNVTLGDAPVTLEFEFRTEAKDRVTEAGKVLGEKSKLRKAKYWYDVPLGAIPVIQKDWPPMPDFMNGRQYFLWWKNEFKMNGESPEIHNPYPELTSPVYVKAGEGSRRWGT